MKRALALRIAAALASVGALLAPAVARADTLGRSPNVVTFEGLVGVAQVHETGGSDSAVLVGTLGTFPLTVPLFRVGYHRVFAPVTLGANVFYGTFAGTSSLALAPRLGAALPIGDSIAVWPRGGITYARVARNTYKQSQTLVAGELLFAVTSLAHAGVLFGPFMELGVGASQSGDGDAPKDRIIGFTLGLLTDF